MPPEDMRIATEVAIQQGLDFPWWSYVFTLILSMTGAYFGAYLKRKAEDRATQENFDKLRDQLRKTTQDTEEIKTTLSRKNWLTQQQWAIREQHYMSLLSHLMKLSLSLEDRNSYYMEPGSEHDRTRSQGEHFKELSRVGYESYQAIRELIGPASVFLSDKAIESLEQLVRDHWGAAEFSAGTAEYVSKALKLVEIAQSAVLAEARNELTHSLADT
ncbi:conserved hypothetical protein [Limnobacter sp. 130]|uniref:hypothetical protein n=1 Tax=Limnobacter sp. 130 TaxID=2653147 RepID=UPI0012F1A1B4|nr:hypothetical protein [Limnobacter sp. 130]VWX36527.1 conserved hypothetical protein [Limnobacter sp. 130]